MTTATPKTRRPAQTVTDGQSAPALVPLGPLLTVREVAELLGTWQTSGERFPRRLIEERRIAFVKVGRHVRIPASAVAQFIAENTVQPIPVRRSTMNRNAA